MVLVLGLFLFTAFPTQKANAQLDIIINPAELIFGDFAVGGDYVINDDMSVDLFLSFGQNNQVFDVFDRSTLKATATFKYYFGPEMGADRWYGSVFLRDAFRTYTAGENGSAYSDYTTNRISAGFGAGFKKVTNSNFVFDIGIGVGRVLNSSAKYDDPDLLEGGFIETNVVYIGKVGIGYRFGGGSGS